MQAERVRLANLRARAASQLRIATTTGPHNTAPAAGTNRHSANAGQGELEHDIDGPTPQLHSATIDELLVQSLGEDKRASEERHDTVVSEEQQCRADGAREERGEQGRPISRDKAPTGSAPGTIAQLAASASEQAQAQLTVEAHHDGAHATGTQMSSLTQPASPWASAGRRLLQLG